jgi:hypothetical protein
MKVQILTDHLSLQTTFFLILFTSICFSKSIINVKLFFKDDAEDYKPIGCVAATLNNSVLYKTHISCNNTVEYFVCKQSEYFLWICSLCFYQWWTFYRFLYFR